MPEENTATTSEATTPDEGQVAEAAEDTKVPEGQDQSQASPEGPTAPEEGQAAGQKKWGKFNSPEEAVKGYEELESKLGNWSEVQAKAEAYDKLTPVLESPSFKGQINVPEVKDPYADMTP